MLRWKFFRYKSVVIFWFLLMCFLFFLPGSALPKEDWLDRIYFDKWVHTGLFAVLLFLWRSSFNLKLAYYNSILMFCALVYGLSVEFIQKYWVVNRSFDLVDVLFDMVGASIGLAAWWWVYKKNKPL
ncbi:MAG: VanZ family protein [Flavisolibacter sp.]